MSGQNYKKFYLIKVLKDGKTIQRIGTHSKKRFTLFLRTINWLDYPITVYLRINYGKKKCAQDCVCVFYNDGSFKTKNEFEETLNAFLAEDI